MQYYLILTNYKCKDLIFLTKLSSEVPFVGNIIQSTPAYFPDSSCLVDHSPFSYEVFSVHCILSIPGQYVFKYSLASVYYPAFQGCYLTFLLIFPLLIIFLVFSYFYFFEVPFGKIASIHLNADYIHSDIHPSTTLVLSVTI